MAQAKSKAKKTAAKPKARKASGSTVAGIDISKFMEDVRIGGYSLDDLLEGSSKNFEAIADANRAIMEGYTDIARRQYEMLKDLLDELLKVSGDKDAVVKDLNRVVEQARKDLQALQKMASKTNSEAQRIIKRRTTANVKAWKKVIAEVREAVDGNAAPKKKAPARKKIAAKKAPAKTKAPARKKAPAKKKAPARKKAPVKKKAPAKKKAAGRKAPAKRKAAPRKKAPAKKAAA